jgi:predicted phosphoribosyltransferase
VTPFRYTDRDDAGLVLARALRGIVTAPALVLAVPRGGVVVGMRVALQLGAPLGLALARKVTLPVAPEVAVGAVDEDGRMLLDPATLRSLGPPAGALSTARAAAWAELDRQRQEYRAPSFNADLPRCAVVVVDDGLATGLTAAAMIAWLRRRGARQVVVAVPYAAESAVNRIVREVDRVVCPIVDPTFEAVSVAYDAFPPVSDDEVRDALARARTPLVEPMPRKRAAVR